METAYDLWAPRKKLKVYPLQYTLILLHTSLFFLRRFAPPPSTEKLFRRENDAVEFIL